MPAPSTVEQLQNWLDTYGPWETRDHFTGPIGFSLVSSALYELEALRAVAEAATKAEMHTAELWEAWRTGAISECDGKGGTRSNRNVDVNVALRDALANLPQPTEP